MEYRNSFITPLTNLVRPNTMIRPPLFHTPQWDVQDKIDLIDAILHVRPIGTIVLAMKPNCTYHNLSENCKYVLDGYNRLCIIQDYMNNEFPCKNYYFSELTGDERLRFYNYKISIQLEVVDKNSVMPIIEYDEPRIITSY
jgi:hypothetical protein